MKQATQKAWMSWVLNSGLRLRSVEPMRDSRFSSTLVRFSSFTTGPVQGILSRITFSNLTIRIQLTGGMQTAWSSDWDDRAWFDDEATNAELFSDLVISLQAD